MRLIYVISTFILLLTIVFFGASVYTLDATLNKKALYTQEDLSETTDQDSSRAVISNHTSYGPVTINKTHIKEKAQVYGPFKAVNDYFNELEVYGPLDMTESEANDVTVFGPTKAKSSRFYAHTTIYGLLIAKSSYFKEIDFLGDKLVFNRSKVGYLKILAEKGDSPNPERQVIKIYGDADIGTIEFESGNGIIYASKNSGLFNTKVIGGEVRYTL